MPETSPGLPAYRHDIDGLRAVAVLLVVFYHVGFRSVPGGFVGVDIFFVISGFLIGGIILREVYAGTFSFAAFYERRVRRILPALLAMLLVVSLLVRHFLFPADLLDYARSLLWTVCSASNVFFHADAGYFNAANQDRPLLHTWSLAVEEQFYLTLPLLLVLLYRWFPRALKPVVWMLALLSFGAACWSLRDVTASTSVPFFLAPWRAWELLLGVLVAMHHTHWIDKAWKRNVLALTGLYLVLAPAFRYHAAGPFPSVLPFGSPGDFMVWQPFPGYQALPPCLGAAMLLAAGRTGTSCVGRALAWRPFAWIGLISYSLYLWHWPIQVLQTQDEFLVSEGHHPALVKPAVLVVSFLAATLSWRFIETPFRRGSLRPRRWLYGLTLPALAALLVVGEVLVHYQGWSIPHVPDSAALTRYLRFDPFYPGNDPVAECFFMPGEAARFTPSACLERGGGRYLVLGDSHGEVFYEGLHRVMPELQAAEVTMAGCAPLIQPAKWMRPDCIEFNRALFDDLARHPVDHVILEAYWNETQEPQIGATLDWIKAHGMEPILVGTNIVFKAHLLRLVMIDENHHDPGVYARHRESRPDRTDRELAALARGPWKVRYISFYEDMCGVDPNAPPTDELAHCPIFATAASPILRDDNHLSPQGVLAFLRTVKQRGQLP